MSWVLNVRVKEGNNNEEGGAAMDVTLNAKRYSMTKADVERVADEAPTTSTIAFAAKARTSVMLERSRLNPLAESLTVPSTVQPFFSASTRQALS